METSLSVCTDIYIGTKCHSSAASTPACKQKFLNSILIPQATRKFWNSTSTTTSFHILPNLYFMVTNTLGRLHLKCDGTRAETRFHILMKRTSPFKSAGMSVQSTTGSWGARISDSNAGYTMFQGTVKSTGYPLHSPVSPSLPLLCVTVCHHISTGLYHFPAEAQCRYKQYKANDIYVT
jgi:hypothetical protein